VTKSSKAIRIWAPCPPTRKQLQAWQDAGADPREKPPVRWRLAPVFAQDQVAPLPPPATPTPLDLPSSEIVGASHEDLIGPLVDLASEIGYTVSFEATRHGDGYCAPRARRIVVADRLAANGRLAVLIHELGHALLRCEPEAEQLSYAQEELVVECIAMCVCQLVGLDTSENSLPYLASWAEQASVEVVEQTVQLTDRVARRIEDRLVAQSAAVKPGEEAFLDAGQAVAA
jgi:hypothetical protein